jgi:hypothetical protein
LDEKVMDCGNKTPNSPRIISCDNTLLYKKQAEAEAHLSIAFTSNGSGGAGGGIPVASMDYPIQTMFHEMLHTYGFDDEYSYKTNGEAEFNYYCSNVRNGVNMAYFKDVPPYADDKAAREKHNSQIPWYGKIPASQLITNIADLGTVTTYQPMGKQTAGLYRGGACDSDKIPGWRPYLNSIMRGYSDTTIYPLYEEVITKQIEAKLGRKLNLPVEFNAADCLNLEATLKQISSLKEDTNNILLKIEENENHFDRGM